MGFGRSILIHRRTFIIWGIGTAAIMAAGCDVLPSSNESEDDTVKPEQVDSIDEANSVTLPEGVAAILVVQGGLLPVTRKWVFYRDGRIQLPNERIVQVDEIQVADTLKSSHVKFMESGEASYPASPGSADFQSTELICGTPNGPRRMVATDASQQVPTDFWQLVNELQALSRSATDSQQ